MDIAIIGLGNSGKTTVFNVMSGAGVQTTPFSDANADPHVAAVKVPDERLDWLSELFKPKKTTPVEFHLTDYAPLVKSEKGKELSNRFMNDIRNSDALALVVRAFEDESVPHPEGSVDPARDLENILLELQFADLDLASRRIERIDESMRKGKKEDRDRLMKEKEFMGRIAARLEEGGSVRDVEMNEEERKLSRGYRFLTETPLIVAVNVGEDQIGKDLSASIRERIPEAGVPVLELSGKIEAELAGLDAEERTAFMEDLGIAAPARDLFIRAAWDALGALYFFTAGEDECRAWEIRRGDAALAAAGKIHSDIAKGFIRAEIVRFDDLKQYGSFAKVKERGLMRLEGKEYVVQDGDIAHFRFNV